MVGVVYCTNSDPKTQNLVQSGAVTLEVAPPYVILPP